MKIGILDTNPPATNKINWNKTPYDAYVRFLSRGNAPLHYENFLVAEGQFPESPEVCDAYLITGSPKGIYEEDEWLRKLEDFIRESYTTGKKLIGICFGHQALAQALGGVVEKSEKGWGLGRKSFEVYQAKSWMNRFKSEPSLYFVHQDQVVELPPDAELLGGNEFCPNIFYTIGNQVLGIQGHPEFSRELMTEIIEGRLARVGKALHRAALKSLDERETDNQRFAEWIVNFLIAEQ